METPVLYFYSTRDTMVDVTVKFRRGFVTEWFPRATVTPLVIAANAIRDPNLESQITWKDVEITPGAPAVLPTESAASHYYAARETDAAPLHVGSQQEKFLFYRGVGQFDPPLTAKFEAKGQIRIANPDGERIGDVILFENRGGSIGYRIIRDADREATIDATVPAASLASLRGELEAILVAGGLYPKEASAMVETWRDSWFEEGTRLFYVPHTASHRRDPAAVDQSGADRGRASLRRPHRAHDAANAARRPGGHLERRCRHACGSTGASSSR